MPADQQTDSTIHAAEDVQTGAQAAEAQTAIDGSGATGEEAVSSQAEQVGSDPREAIYAKFDAQRRAEAGEKPAEEQAKSSDSTQNEEAEADTLVPVKVDGVVHQVSRAKIEAAGGLDVYQKRLAAEQRLAQASAERRRLSQREAELNALAAQLEERQRTMQQNKEPAATAVDSEALRENATKIVSTIFDGKTDDAVDALVTVLGARQATPDPDEIARKAAATLRQEQEREAQQRAIAEFEEDRAMADATFADKYPEIAEDPLLFDMTNARTAALLKEHPDWKPSQIVDKAAQDVSEWVKRRLAPPPKTSAEVKQEGKRGLTTVRGTASARNIPRPAPAPQSNSQYVSELRKQRGLE